MHCVQQKHGLTVEVVSWPELSVVVTMLLVMLPPEVLLPPDEVLLPPDVVLFEPPRPPADEVELLDPAPAPEVELLGPDPAPAPEVELLVEPAPAGRVVVAVALAPVATTTVSVPDAEVWVTVLALLVLEPAARAAKENEQTHDKSVDDEVQLTLAEGVSGVDYLAGVVWRARLYRAVMNAVSEIRVGAQANSIARGAAFDLGEHARDTELLKANQRV